MRSAPEFHIITEDAMVSFLRTFAPSFCISTLLLLVFLHPRVQRMYLTNVKPVAESPMNAPSPYTLSPAGSTCSRADSSEFYYAISMDRRYLTSHDE